MTKKTLYDYISCGREIEFQYHGKMFSITYSPSWEEDFISFCEFYKEPVNVKTADELIKIKYDGVTVLEMLESLTENDIWIY